MFCTLEIIGYIAGKGLLHRGGGTDNLCLPDDPTWLNYTDGLEHPSARIYGTQIQIDESSNIFPYQVSGQTLPCAVCMSEALTTLMIPGRGECYDGWHAEYKGYLMSSSYIQSGGFNHICVDSEPVFVPNENSDIGTHSLNLVEAKCGSLPCPPYVNGREIACVVCSK